MCSDILTLDSSQLSVVTAAPEDRQYVIAAAGQGKTEVLLARVNSLIRDGLNPAENILVLSFSRAAVGAVKRRAIKHDLDGLQVRTFDSFATRILLDEDEDSAFEGGFEARIRKATSFLVSDDVPHLIRSIEHVLIDEGQDVVGDRAEFIFALFEALDDEVGFTVLGDPLQGIYDFQLQESVSRVTSSDFLNALIEEFKATETQLSHHYRAVTPRAKKLIQIGDAIRGLDILDTVECKNAHRLLNDYILGSTSNSPLDVPGILEPFEGDTTTLLCSTNYEVLIASELLWENGFRHVIRRKTQDMSVAPWVYMIFKDLEDRTYPASEIKERLVALNGDEAVNNWLALKTAEGDYAAWDSLNVPKLSQRLRSRSAPLALTVDDSAPLVLSTVHRAKGLEFTNVLYVQPPHGSPAAEENPATLRQKYVALSRAREEVITTKLPRESSKWPKTVSGRWTEKRYGKFGKYTARMEFINSDIDDTYPFVPPESTAKAVQKNLVLEELLGRVISGILIDESDEEPSYLLSTSDGQIVGTTSPSFANALRRSFGFKDGKNWHWPLGFSGARVTSIECATGHPDFTKATDLGASGMWLVPRLTGLITLTWK